MARKTHEEYLLQLQERNIKTKPLEKYRNMNTKILHKCVCGNAWSVMPNNVISGQKCGCNRVPTPTKTHERYLQDLREKGISVMPLEQYRGMHTKIKHKCVCGNEWTTTPDKVLHQKAQCGCRVGKMHKRSHEKYLLDLKRKKIEVLPLEEYKGADTKSLHRCICENEWLAKPNSVLRGALCGCVKSRGEKLIENFLLDNTIDFKTEISFFDLRGKNDQPYRYDFAILNNKIVVALIEFHGKQHFRFIKYWHKTKEKFIASQKRDQIKRDYAQNKGIPLIEITYKEKDSIQALEKELKALGIMEPQKRKYEQLSLF